MEYKCFHGQGVTGGCTLGCAVVRRSGEGRERAQGGAASLRCGSPEEEWQRFVAAQTEAQRSLLALYEEQRQRLGEESAAIFEMQSMMLRDRDVVEAVRQGICEDGLEASAALRAAIARLARRLEQMRDPYLRERAADVREIGARMLHLLAGEADEDAWQLPGEPCILCTEELTVARTAALSPERVTGLILARGSVTSHAAIVARALGIPALVGVGAAALSQLHDGMELGLDAAEGVCYLSLDDALRERLRERRRLWREALAAGDRFRGRETRTAQGQRVLLYANVSGAEEVEAAVAGDAEGIGLFRSEFLFLAAGAPPDEQAQTRIYRQVLQRMAGKRVIIRTADLGADKQPRGMAGAHEENPALGCRGVRRSLRYPDEFLVQARALCRASDAGRLAVMFPMVATVSELRRILALWEQAREQTGAARIELGVMIETPAAALISDELADMVDFFSIGSNDLTQYTLAMDRLNEQLQPLIEPHHAAVLSLIRTTVQNAHAKGIWVGLCGELAADTTLTQTLLAMGIDELSVAPSEVLTLREHIAAIGSNAKEKERENAQ